MHGSPTGGRRSRNDGTTGFHGPKARTRKHRKRVGKAKRARAALRGKNHDKNN